MDRGILQATVHEVPESQIQLKLQQNFSMNVSCMCAEFEAVRP